MRARIEQAKIFFETHERMLSGGALLFGFIVDSLTLRRIDLLAENIAIISYLSVAALSIILLAHRERGYEKSKILSWGVAVAPLALQIVFGALFSAFVVFYSRSASLSASWPLIGFLALILLGNETFRKRYEKFVFHAGIFFVALLSYALLFVPILVRSIGVVPFLLSIVLSLVLFAVFILMVRVIAPREVAATTPVLSRLIPGIAILFIVAYLTGLMPPAPLSLSDSAVAHALSKSGESYELSVEPRSLRDRLVLSEEYHRSFGEDVYVWTSVFAPTKLSTSIVHVWQYKEGGEWKTTNEVTFPITGGRSEGYRGYSLKENILPGEWRVSVETEDNLVIGRVRFDVVDAKEPPYVMTVVR